ncbi:hypothetical protein MSAS_10790 [Mycobacterium saskatchewanense]|uniref:Nitronate monooxygenase domain-containing protein n=1 Tax=Mycobacterium saskatchewanense TaxID=220927 RepID=A0AAJ3NVB2_9MYCO|nr:hypothetical protein AWC23_05040 [Mycobacterium saskatchewanense]BBX61905.1 hypothetical protein MSAS_10790 [Mycobacterium saskatchewanense]
MVSFTFGIPGHGVIRDLQRAGTTVVQTVTSLQEAKAAAAAGVDALAVQATVAGGHSATLTPDRPPPAATSPLRKAAAAAGDPELVHLWAGTGYRHARRQPTEQILSRLVP